MSLKGKNNEMNISYINVRVETSDVMYVRAASTVELPQSLAMPEALQPFVADNLVTKSQQ